MIIDSNKKQTLIITVSFLTAFLVLLFLVVIPLTKKVYQQKDALEEAKLTLERDRKNVDKYKENLEYLRENSDLSENIRVDENNRVQFIEDIEKIALEQELELEISIHQPVSSNKQKAAVEQTFLKINLEGDYEKFMNFVYKVQNIGYFVAIKSVSVEKFDDSKIKILKNGNVDLNNLPEIEGEVIISLN